MVSSLDYFLEGLIFIVQLVNLLQFLLEKDLFELPIQLLLAFRLFKLVNYDGLVFLAQSPFLLIYTR